MIVGAAEHQEKAGLVTSSAFTFSTLVSMVKASGYAAEVDHTNRQITFKGGGYIQVIENKFHDAKTTEAENT
jgi:sulfite exporter TauE/SafE